MQFLLALHLLLKTEMKLNLFYDEKVSRNDLFFFIGIAYIPVLLNQYFFWYNLVTYCAPNLVSSIDEIETTRFISGFSLNQILSFGKISWIACYLIMIWRFYCLEIKLYKILISVLFPSFLVVIINYLLD